MKFHKDLISSFWVFLLTTDKQKTDRQKKQTDTVIITVTDKVMKH